MPASIGVAEVEVIARILRRTDADVARQVHVLEGKVHTHEWTSRDVQMLKRLYGTRSTEDLSLILGRPVERIEEKADEFCLAKDKGYMRRIGSGRVRMPRWTKEEIQHLVDMYSDHSNLEIARFLGRSEKSVVSKAHDLGLKKSSSRLRRMGRENVAVRYGLGEEEEGDFASDGGGVEAGGQGA